jgi:hypothetical protein
MCRAGRSGFPALAEGKLASNQIEMTTEAIAMTLPFLPLIILRTILGNNNSLHNKKIETHKKNEVNQKQQLGTYRQMELFISLSWLLRLLPTQGSLRASVICTRSRSNPAVRSAKRPPTPDFGPAA